MQLAARLCSQPRLQHLNARLSHIPREPTPSCPVLLFAVASSMLRASPLWDSHCSPRPSIVTTEV
jgi:hypothetical protein